MASTERIGFLGLGIMGSRMAANLARAGYEMSVWTHTDGKAAAWAEQHGARACATPSEVARASDVIVSMVVDGAQVETIVLGEDGAAKSARPGLLLIDCSTIAPGDTRRIGAALAEQGAAMIDAPVTGSSPRAEAGTLTIMAGGERADFERALPVLEVMGELILHVGALGQGEMLKLINNALGAANATAVAEALVLAEATGIAPEDLVAAAMGGSGGSAQMQLKSSAMSGHDYTTFFKTDHMLKDVRLCLEEAQRAGVPFPSASHARDLLSAASGRGYGEQDYASIVEAAEGFAGRRIED